MTRENDESPKPAADDDSTEAMGRRRFLRFAGTGALGAALSSQAMGQGAAGVSLGPIQAPTEAPDKTPVPDHEDQRVGFAIVGLGHLSLNQILPAFGKSKFAKPVALVSGNRAKALEVAREYGIASSAIYDYSDFEKLQSNKQVQVVYIVLPNSMHAEFTVRAAKIKKHVLCEKPMATSVADCERMIAACRDAQRLLMIAYRSQYEPLDRTALKMARSGDLGKLRQFVASNVQNQGDPSQWRLKKAMAGGGALVDVGIYCLNAARFLSGEEPSSVLATMVQPKDDPRFTEVEESISFLLNFPSGLTAVCTSGYGSHSSKYFRLQGSDAWVGMDPAFEYGGLRLMEGTLKAGRETTTEIHFDAADQFALEMDHFAHCVKNNVVPHTPGEEGLQDQKIVEAIYASAASGRRVTLAPALVPRGPEITEMI